jgi:beta-lactam-binding protein with PASTA domain
MSVPGPPERDAALVGDTAEFDAVDVEGPVRKPAPPGPPPGWLRAENPWPWLLLVAIAAVAILVWLLVIRGHSNRHVVPRVVGLRQQVAIVKLNDAGFDVTAVRRPSRLAGGHVFAQKPGAGSQLKKGQTVVIDVSSGAKPVTAKPKTTTTSTTTTKTVTPTKVAMPNVTGKPLADAGAAIAAAGLVPDSAPVQASQAAGTVVSQSPGAGASLRAGSVVTLRVAQGPANQPAVAVPNVTGQTAADALTKLWSAKLTARTLYRKGKVGIVLQQQPGPGNAPAYSQVTLSVGR